MSFQFLGWLCAFGFCESPLYAGVSLGGVCSNNSLPKGVADMQDVLWPKELGWCLRQFPTEPRVCVGTTGHYVSCREQGHSTLYDTVEWSITCGLRDITIKLSSSRVFLPLMAFPVFSTCLKLFGLNHTFFEIQIMTSWFLFVDVCWIYLCLYIYFQHLKICFYLSVLYMVKKLGFTL